MAKCDYDALPDNAQKGGSEVYMSDGLVSPVSVDDLLQNYSDAYYELFTDKFFLLDVQQVVNMHNNEDMLGDGYFKQYKTTGTPYHYPYLIMAPAYGTHVYRLSMDNNNGMFYAQPATYIECYARATFYLDPTEKFLGGGQRFKGRTLQLYSFYKRQGQSVRSVPNQQPRGA